MLVIKPVVASQSPPMSGTLAALGNLGRVSPVTEDDMADAMRDRYFLRKVTVRHEPVRHEPVRHAPVVTRAQAISIACDEMIHYYKLPHTSTHPYRYKDAYAGEGARYYYVEAVKWDSIIKYGAKYANAYMTGNKLPDWVTGISAGVATHGVAGFGQTEPYGPPAPTTGNEWWPPPAWAVEGAAGLLNAWGKELRADDAKKIIQETFSKELLASRENIAKLTALLQAQTNVNPATLKEGVEMAAAMPSWVWPVVIGAGVLVIFMMIGR